MDEAIHSSSIRFWVMHLLLLELLMSGNPWEGLDHRHQSLTWFYAFFLEWIISLPSPLLLEISQEWRQKDCGRNLEQELSLSDHHPWHSGATVTGWHLKAIVCIANNERKCDKCEERHYQNSTDLLSVVSALRLTCLITEDVFRSAIILWLKSTK